MENLFHTFIYVPIYNLLVFLVDTVPGGDLGLAVIIATLIVKLVMMPLSLAAAKTQRAMRTLEPELKALRERYKDDKETQAREMFALYKKNGVKPFASILMLFIQIPIVFGLYFVCLAVSKTGAVDGTLLYSFVANPQTASTLFLGYFPVVGMSIGLAILAGLSQFAQAHYVIKIPEKTDTSALHEEFGRALAIQARYMLPVLIGLFSLTSGVLALYFTASNLFMVAQEWVSKTIHKDVPQTA